MTVKTGREVADWIEQKTGAIVSAEAIQPNGVDLTVETIHEHATVGVLGDGNYTKPERNEVQVYKPGEYVTSDIKKGWKPENVEQYADYTGISPDTTTVDEPSYFLSGGAYVVEYGEIIEIPEDCVGMVMPRSRVMRCGGHITTALWDPGYRGAGEGQLFVGNPMFVEKGMHIGQIIYIDADEAGKLYNGSHQGEGL